MRRYWMTRLEFAKLIISGRDFKIKSHYFGECKTINGENYIVLYDKTKAPPLKLQDGKKNALLYTWILRYTALRLSSDDSVCF